MFLVPILPPMKLPLSIIVDSKPKDFNFNDEDIPAIPDPIIRIFFDIWVLSLKWYLIG